MKTIKRPMPSHFGDRRVPAGMFVATCQIGHDPEAFEVNGPALFEAHMLTEHGAKPGMCAKRAHRTVNGQTVWGKIDGFTHRGDRKQLRLGKGLWNGPKLTEEGKPFEPSGLEPGATVTWREFVGSGEFYEDPALGTVERKYWAERSGQVWCEGWRPKSAWVIPFTPLEGEQAVMVEQRSNGVLEHYSTQESPTRRAA